MVEAIYELKNMLLGKIEQDAQSKGIERIDPQMVDMVKDLAKAEKDCWEAEYYRSVSEAMEGGSGYQMGYSGMSGSQMGTYSRNAESTSQSGSRAGYRDSMGRYARRGYSDGYRSHIDALKMELQNADPQERERIMQEIRSM